MATKLNTLAEICKDAYKNPNNREKQKRKMFALGEFGQRLEDGAIEDFDLWFEDAGKECPHFLSDLTEGELVAMSTWVNYFKFDENGNIWERYY